MSVNIRINNAVKRYGSNTVIDGLSLDVKKVNSLLFLVLQVAERRPCSNDSRLLLYRRRRFLLQ